MLTKVLVDKWPEGWGNRRSGPVGMRTPIYDEASKGVMLNSEQIRDALVTGGLRYYEQVVAAGYLPR